MTANDQLLISASHNGLVSIVQSCLVAGADVNTKSNCSSSGLTPLIAAVANNQTKVLAVLLNCPNLDLAATNNTGMTGLHMACYKGHSICVRMLGKDRRMTPVIINVKDRDGETARMLAEEWGNKSCLKEMHKLDGVEKLYNASKAGDMATVQAYLAAGVDVNARHSNGWTPLIAAIAYNHSQVVSALLSCQTMDIGATTGHGRTVLHWACLYGSSDCVTLLGRDGRVEQMVNTKDSYGDTALVLAVEKGYLACVEEMAKLDGVDWETKSADGKSLEDVARRCEEMEILRFLSKRKGEYLEDNAAPSQNKKMKLSKLAEQLESLETLETEIEIEIIKLKDEHKTSEEELQEKYKKEREHLDETFKKQRDNLDKELKENMAVLKYSNQEEEESLAKEHKNRISQKKALENEIKNRFSPRTPPLPLAPECPVCLEEMPPPMNIYNCPNGHFVCGNCKPKVTICPTCVEPVMGRATGMEQMLRAMYKTE